jgi:hypothetical protein
MRAEPAGRWIARFAALACVFSALGASPLACPDLWSRYWVPRRPEQGLPIALGREVPFPGPIQGIMHIEGAALRIKAGTDVKSLRSMSRLLAHGGRGEDEIFRKLRAHQRSQAPLPLEDVLPPFVKERLNTVVAAGCDEINCFSAALNWRLPQVGPRYVNPQEFSRALDEQFERIYRNQDAQLGDLIVFRFGTEGSLRSSPAHAAVYIDQNLIWHKRDLRRDVPFTFSSLETTILDFQEWGRRQMPQNQRMFVEFYRPKAGAPVP